MTGWRIETAALVGTVVAVIVGLASGIELTFWTVIYLTCIYSIIFGLIMAKCARKLGRAGRKPVAWGLAIGAGILLFAGVSLTILTLMEPRPVDNAGHDL